ncbi:hypothetical protein Tco_0593385 [Tanacetum coccineum]
MFIEQSHDEVYGCLKGGSGNSGGKRLAISMVEEAWLNSPFDLIAYTNSDYAGASLDINSTTGGCQILGCRLISWQCKKQIVVSNSITEVEYVAALSCCGQVLWI